MTKLIPLHDEIVVDYQAPPSMSAGGIYIPERVQRINEEYTKGVVIGVGSKVWDIKPDDIVYVIGHRSGRRLGQKLDSLYVVKQDMCHMIEEKE